MDITELSKEYTLSKDDIDKIDRYMDILLEWNKIHSYTTLDSKSKLLKTIYEVLYPVNIIKKYTNIIDIGSGAGIPIIPLSIAIKNIKFIAIEPIKKRVSFLNYIKSVLNIDNLTIFNGRIEEYKNSYSELLIMSKAVAEVSMILELTRNIKYDKMLLYKGSNLSSELKDIKIDYNIEQNGKINYLYIEGNR